MPLRRLTKMSKLELETESKELKATIAALATLLKSDEAMRKQVSDELTAVSKAYAVPRRTRLATA
jgi:DNA gyrase/topoisomerase IV subunit A